MQSTRARSGADTWLITYADMVTLLLALFVMLYAVLVGTEAGQGDLIRRYQMEFLSRIGEGAARQTLYKPSQPKPEALPLSGPDLLNRDLLDFAMPLGEAARVERLGDAVRLTLTSDILFQSASARLSDSARDALAQLAPVLARHPGSVIVAGHTDRHPFKPNNPTPYRDNWDLSAARAISVVRELERNGVSPGRLRAVGYADTRPRDAEGRTGADYDAWQRRVELLIAPGSVLGSP